MRGYAFCAVLMLVLSAVPAMAQDDDDYDSGQSDRRFGSSTTYGPDGIYTTYDRGSTSRTYGPNGEFWSTRDMGRYEVTRDSHGNTWTTYKR